MDLGPHAAFVWTAYGLVAAVLALLVIWLVADGRKQRRLLDALGTRGENPRGRSRDE